VLISERLKTAVDEARHPVFADVGCDHAYAAIYAILNKRAERAYACDVNAGPSGRAAENIKRYGLENKIEVRLGPGLTPLDGTDAETVMIAGLGGYLTVEILTNGLKYTPSLKQLILQPMSEVPRVRRYLRGAGFAITNERVVYEDGKYYFILNCVPTDDSVCSKPPSNRAPSDGSMCNKPPSDITPYTEAEYEFGRFPVGALSEALAGYLRAEAEKTKKALTQIGSPAGERARVRRDELINRLGMIKTITDGRRPDA